MRGRAPTRLNHSVRKCSQAEGTPARSSGVVTEGCTERAVCELSLEEDSGNLLGEWDGHSKKQCRVNICPVLPWTVPAFAHYTGVISAPFILESVLIGMESPWGCSSVQ